MVKVEAVKNTENAFKIQLTENNSVINHTTITAAKLKTSDGVVIADSEVSPTLWSFANPSFIVVKFGLASVNEGIYTCKLITKDSVNTIGIAWDTEINLEILP